MLAPGAIKFFPDHLICGDTYRSVWALREYPPQTAEQAILCRFGDRENVTVHLYSRAVDSMEQRRILQNATRKNKLQSASEDVQESITAEGNIEDVVTLLAEMRKNREPLLHCAAYIELCADSLEHLKALQSEAAMELTRQKLSVDRLTLRQKEGFLTVMPCSGNHFGSQYERVLPASSVANLYPLSYSGKTDPQGFPLGRDRYGTHILVDFDRRAEDKTNSNILILGNSGQGKSYLMKLILTNLREAGKSIIILDAEQEYEDLTRNLGGCYIDLMSGEYIINPLEPRAWADEPQADDDAPEAFRRSTRLSQHISYLKDFFRAYKDFSDEQIDAIEILVATLYANFGIDDRFVCFGVKGLMDANRKLKDAMLFNILAYMNHRLLIDGNTVASVDELYLFLTNLTAIEYIRNAAKRVRKRDSAIILASQNIEDFLVETVKEYTKPLFSIPTHQFLFHAGSINPREYMDAIQIEPSEFELIRQPERGVCLYKCGNERYLLQVIAPEHKAVLFGHAGRR